MENKCSEMQRNIDALLNILNWLIHTLVYEYKENIWMRW